MRKKFKSSLSLLIAAIILITSFSACSSRGGEGSDISDEASVSSEPKEGAGITSDTMESSPNLAPLASEKWAENNDTVGWLRVPGTTIDDVVVWKEGDNDFYLRRNFEKRHFYNGVYYADKRSTFGEGSVDDLGRNTVIYGHSMSDNKDDVKFGPVRYYLDEDFAKTHPYIYFSTTEDDLAWEVVAVFYTHWDIPYNRNDLSFDEFKDMYGEVTDRSVYTYDHELKESDKFLTLSTCVYSLPDKGALEYPNVYRFGIMARLVEPGEELKKEASFVKNSNIKSA
ncbi:MAG: class B sortase [Oscillospiraceae bacterium]|jgi:sortase B|nr:class B sortase [Oscillospiraceae bacterium]